jgi:hypothetical protein
LNEDKSLWIIEENTIKAAGVFCVGGYSKIGSRYTGNITQ